MDKVDDLYARRLARESKAREEAERLLEQKSLELFLEMEERQRALDALRESEERYRLIVELSPDAILIESGGRIVFANNAAKKLFRETEQTRLLDHSLLDLTTSDCRDMVEQSIAQSRLNNVSTYAEETARRLDGTTFEVSVRRVALTYGGQAATHTVARDFPDRKKLER